MDKAFLLEGPTKDALHNECTLTEVSSLFKLFLYSIIMVLMKPVHQSFPIPFIPSRTRIELGRVISLPELRLQK